MQLNPGHPGRKWIIFIVAVLISAGSIIYTNSLVRQIDERERQQIELYARTLEYLANENTNPNFILLLDEIVLSNATIPVILTDEYENPEQYRNLPKADKETDPRKRRDYLTEQIQLMKADHEPIEITLQVSDEILGTKFIFYKSSLLLTQLSYYPYVQLSIIGVVVLVIFGFYSSSRAAEQNRVWVGLAKETAHQLGTPLSSLMAWSHYFKETYPDDIEVLKELDKDISSLETITARFSSIGSVPQLNEENVAETVEEIVGYLTTRLSTKIEVELTYFPHRNLYAKLNKSLFAWVIENLMKNAADAMDGKGKIQVSVMKVGGGVAVDISDTGKGLSKTLAKQVFNAGFTTKKRGWGLGLTLAKRIVQNYHKGKIFLTDPEQGFNTTFRVFLTD